VNYVLLCKLQAAVPPLRAGRQGAQGCAHKTTAGPLPPDPMHPSLRQVAVSTTPTHTQPPSREVGSTVEHIEDLQEGVERPGCSVGGQAFYQACNGAAALGPRPNHATCPMPPHMCLHCPARQRQVHAHTSPERERHAGCPRLPGPAWPSPAQPKPEQLGRYSTPGQCTCSQQHKGGCGSAHPQQAAQGVAGDSDHSASDPQSSLAAIATRHAGHTPTHAASHVPQGGSASVEHGSARSGKAARRAEGTSLLGVHRCEGLATGRPAKPVAVRGSSRCNAVRQTPSPAGVPKHLL